MPPTDIIIYQDEAGNVPLLEWIDSLPERVQIKCTQKIELLEKFGFDLQRPHCDILKSGIYELRARRQNVHYRVLYCFVGQNKILLSHGCIKKGAEMREIEIKGALRNLANYAKSPDAHTYKGEW